jgi:hypothetical protein
MGDISRGQSNSKVGIRSKEYQRMVARINAERELNGRPLFISGYFSERIWKGEQPVYGYPKNHLPEATIREMEVKTGFVAALESK